MSAQVTPEEVKKVAHLGRLGLSEEELSRAAQQISSILDHFSQIQKIDTKGVPTSDDVTGLKNVTREDEAKPDDLCTAQELLERAPETQNGQIKVKAIFE